MGESGMGERKRTHHALAASLRLLATKVVGLAVIEQQAKQIELAHIEWAELSTTARELTNRCNRRTLEPS